MYNNRYLETVASGQILQILNIHIYIIIIILSLVRICKIVDKIYFGMKIIDYIEKLRPVVSTDPRVMHDATPGFFAVGIVK